MDSRIERINEMEKLFDRVLQTQSAFEKAVEAGVAFVPGTHFYIDGEHLNTLRLNFSMCDIPAIEEGMAKLGKVISGL